MCVCVYVRTRVHAHVMCFSMCAFCCVYVPRGTRSEYMVQQAWGLRCENKGCRCDSPPTYLTQADESLTPSLQHAGHAGNTAGTPAFEARETHFKLELVSDRFSGLPPVKRHQLVGKWHLF